MSAFHNLNEKKVFLTEMSKQGFKGALSHKQKLPLPLKRDDSPKISYSKSQFIHAFTYLFTMYLLSSCSMKGTMPELKQMWSFTHGTDSPTGKLDTGHITTQGNVKGEIHDAKRAYDKEL